MSDKENIQEAKILNNFNDLNIDLDFYFSEEGREPNDAILEIYSNLLLESGLFEEQPTYSKFEDRTSGVDGYLISDKDLHLFKTNLSKDYNQINNLTSKGIDIAHNKLIRFFDKSFNDDFVELLPAAAEGREVAQTIRALDKEFNGIKIVHLHFITNERRGDILKWKREREKSSAMPNTEFRFHLWDLGWYNSILESARGVEDIEISFNEGIKCLLASSNDAPLKSYLAVLPGQLIADWFDEYGDRLIEQNVRTYLQARGNVNKGISRTIENEPDYFLPYNNGLTASCTDIKIEKKDNLEVIKSIKNLQIVNGGQTSGSLLRAKSEGKDLSKIFVQLKISKVDIEKESEIIPRISEYSNTQNKVSAADFISNRNYQIQIEQSSKKCLVQDTSRNRAQTLWFYERVRGQYNNQPNIGASNSEKKAFQRRNPKDQKLDKTQLAKYYNTFECLPHEVSKGAQKNLMKFADNIEKKLGEKEDISFINELFYKETIGKAILYRRIEKEFLKADWYEGYRAQIVNYSLSWLTNFLKEKDYIIDFEKIWREQSISDDVVKNINIIGRKMSDLIIREQPGSSVLGRIPSEYTKTQNTWDSIRKIKIERITSTLFEDIIISLNKNKDKQKSAKAERKEVTNAEKMIIVSKINQGWIEIYSLARKEKLLTPSLIQIEKNLIKHKYQFVDTDFYCDKLYELIIKMKKSHILDKKFDPVEIINNHYSK